MTESVSEGDIVELIKKINPDLLLEKLNKITSNKIIEGCDTRFNDDIHAIVESCVNSYDIFLELIDREHFIEALGILRSIFECVLMVLAIYYDNETYEVYTKYNKTKEQKRKISPGAIREKVITVLDEKYNLDSMNWKDEINDYYSQLCMIIHPSILRVCLWKISLMPEDKKNIKVYLKIIGLKTKYLLLFFLYSSNVNSYFEVYTANMLLECITMDNDNSIVKILNTNKKYLHLDVNNDLSQLFEDVERSISSDTNENESVEWEKYKNSIKLIAVTLIIANLGTDSFKEEII